MLDFIIVLWLFVLCHTEIPHYNKNQIQDKIGKTRIMYGATIRLKANMFNYHLHSHEVNYPRGSGQQSVTGFQGDNDYNSLWTIKQPHNQRVKTYSHGLQCGDTIRLQHALTKRNLHSEELYQSMITNNQQISAYGQSGFGNQSSNNDNWIIKCVNRKDQQQFYGGDLFQLIHEETDKRLKMSRYYQYSWNNWEDCPFEGQLQICATEKPSVETQFKIVGGVFFKQSQEKQSNNDNNSQDL